MFKDFRQPANNNGTNPTARQTNSDTCVHASITTQSSPPKRRMRYLKRAMYSVYMSSHIRRITHTLLLSLLLSSHRIEITNFISMQTHVRSVHGFESQTHTHTPTCLSNSSPLEKKHTFPWEVSTPFPLPFDIEQASLCREQSVCLFYFRSQLLCGHGVREWCTAEGSMRRALSCGHGSISKQWGCRWTLQVGSRFSRWSHCRLLKMRVVCVCVCACQ